MNRGRFLGSVAGATAIAGCTGSNGGTSTTEVDTDGDGIPDSDDYAPKDPAVQSKSDLEEVTKTAARTTATTAAPAESTTAPPEPTPTTTTPPTTTAAPTTTTRADGH